MKTKFTLFKKALMTAALLFSGVMTYAATFTAVTNGDYSSSATWGGVAPPSTVTSDDIIIPANIDVELDVDVEFVGILSSLDIEGTLSGKANNTSLTITQVASVTGSGNIDIEKLEIGTLGAFGFSGAVDVNQMVSSSTSLVITAAINIADSLILEAGSVTLNTNGDINIMTDAVVIRDAGAITISGGTFTANNSYDVRFIGGNKTAGVELSGSNLDEIMINLNTNNTSVSLSSDLTASGTINIQQGNLDLNGNDLTISGDYVATASGNLMGDANSNLVFNNSTTLTSMVGFETSSQVINDLVINASNNSSVSLNSTLSFSGEMLLEDGELILESNANLVAESNSEIFVEDGELTENGGSFDGALSYDLTYSGSSKDANLEASGSGLNNLTIDMDDNTQTLTLNSNATVNGDLEIASGQLVANSNSIVLMGDFSTNSTGTITGDSNFDLTISSSTDLSADLTFTSGSEMVNDFTINIQDGGDVSLGSGLTVEGTLDFQNGRLDIQDNNLAISATGNVSGSTTTSYVVTSGTGMLSINLTAGGSFEEFAVGTESNFAAIDLQQNSGASSGEFMVRVQQDVKAEGSTGFDESTTQSVVDMTWFVESQTATSIDLNMKAEWESTAEVNGFDRTNAFISHYVNSDWDVNATTTATATGNGTFEIQRDNISSLSPFAVMDENAAVTVEEQLTDASFNLYPNPAKDFVQIQYNTITANEVQVDVFDVTGKLVPTDYNINNSGVQTFDVSNYTEGIYYVKMSSEGIDSITKKFVVIK